ncbi:hypothetical protein BO86DRAFT_433624, partial [Aspergillus japonicus CBS 114.51]
MTTHTNHPPETPRNPHMLPPHLLHMAHPPQTTLRLHHRPPPHPRHCAAAPPPRLVLPQPPPPGRPLRPQRPRHRLPPRLLWGREPPRRPHPGRPLGRARPPRVSGSECALREPEIVAFVRYLRGSLGFERVVELGGGGFGEDGSLGESEGDGGDGYGEGQPQYLVDCVPIGHPSLLTEEDIAGVQVPVQVLAPQRDPVYTAQLKAFTVQNLQERGVPFEYRFFPGVEHGCFTRGDEGVPGESEAV